MGEAVTGGRSSVPRAFGCAVAGVLVLLGCTGGGAARDAGARPAPSTSGQGSPSAAPTAPAVDLIPELDEAKQPRSAAEARDLLSRIMIGPGTLGPEVVPGTPAESDPDRWPVLDRDCVWQSQAPPADVLASRTRYFQIPARDGHRRVRINATVTVHHDRRESGWETARAMEEILRCPSQRLRDGEELKNLLGASVYQGEQMNGWTEDAFSESGQYVSTEDGGPHRYLWHQAQFGPVTVAITGKGAEGFTDAALNALVVQGTSQLLQNAKQALAKEAG
ncbi:hypothetical protein ACFWUQ_23095 [Streptomyces sp. NPDC058662]|uniref:hypothetical protein n=1 Tax=Streptomyces sp. NPDC058662 TaxID=3346583 RepID=UPI00365E480E